MEQRSPTLALARARRALTFMNHLVLSALLSFLPVIVALFCVSGLMAIVQILIGAAKRRRLLDGQRDLTTLRAMSWRDLEHFVAEAYKRKGYRVEMKGGRQADGGVDVILRRENRVTLVQCKQWRSKQVGVTIVRELYGVMAVEKAHAGIVVTCGYFTADAKAFAAKTAQERRTITLVNGAALLELVRDVQSLSSTQSGRSKKAKLSSAALCPKCGSPMVSRMAKKGKNAGGQFYGCSRYPDCNGIRPM